MSLVANYEPMWPRYGREVIRCRRCGLVQFRPRIQCRRCHVEFREWAEPDPLPWKPKGWTHPAVPATDIGLAILFWRRVYGISQKELARRMGIPRQHICRMEKRYHDPLLRTCERYAQAFGISVRLLVLTAEGLSMQQRSKQRSELSACA